MPNQQQILKSIAAVAKQLGRAPSVSEFVARAGIPKYFVFRYFPTWNEAVRAAGLRPSKLYARPDDMELLKGWGETVRKLRTVPSRRAYRLKGRHSPRTLETRFGCWAALPQAFCNFAEGKQEWADVLALALVPARKKKESRESKGDSFCAVQPGESATPAFTGTPHVRRASGLPDPAPRTCQRTGRRAPFWDARETFGLRGRIRSSRFP